MPETVETPLTFDTAREDRLRGLKLEFAIGSESAKHFDVAEMRCLRDDLTAMLGEIDALRTSLSSVSRERDALTAQLKVATTPDVLNVIGEDGCEFLETAFGGLFETIPANECREVWANKSLPNHWAALLYRAADDSASIEIFPTEADARAAIAASLAVSSPAGDSL